LIGAAAEVDDTQSLSFQYGIRHSLEMRQLDRARSEVNQADSPLHFIRRMLGRTEQSAQPSKQGLHVRTEQARLHAREQVLRREERADLGSVQPETG
jgi:hypothetical protein